MSILVAGGAGYIGSVTVEELVKRGEEVVILDDLSKGYKRAVHPSAKFVKGDIGDEMLLDKVIKDYVIDSVIHFAAVSLVGESMKMPENYFDINVVRSLKLLNSMLRNGVKKIIFSSTAAVYGEPQNIPILESEETNPVNNYGKTKLFFEETLDVYRKAYGLKYISLRYFNAAGASENYGENHNPETHLIPIILEVVQGKRDYVEVYGDDYPTKDGSCIRDYIHIIDIAEAHILALEALRKSRIQAYLSPTDIYNLGNGNGYSVFEVINCVKEVSGKNIPIKIGKRRVGDPSILVASSEKIKKELGWKPRFPELKSIVQSAYSWRLKYPEGYKL